MNKRNKQSGFTLLELLVVVAIVGILASVAVGRYRTYIISSNRQNAQNSLLLAQQAMERHFLNTGSYEGGLSSAGQVAAVSQALIQNSSVVQNQAYVLNVANVTATTYLISAVPNLAIQNDPQCGALTITETGQKGIGGNGNVDDCWR